MIRLFPIGLLIACLSVVGLPAADWNQFRGPSSNGDAGKAGIPLVWSGTDQNQNILWKTDLQGIGYSSPVVKAGKVFLTTCLEKELERVVLCHDLESGKQLWSRSVIKAPLETRHQLSSCANSTPAVDDQRVYCSFLDKDRFVLVSHDHQGKELWRKDLGKYVNKHGFCSSPILCNNLLLVAGDNDAAGFFTAIKPSTGETVWRHERKNPIRSFSVPVPYSKDGKHQVLLSGCRGLTSFEPQTGKVLWEVETPTEKYVAAAVVAEDVALISGSSPANTLWGVNPLFSAKASNDRVLWRENSNALYTCSPVAVGSRVYGVTDNGFAWCLDAKTGKKFWTERMGKAHHASLVHVDGHILVFDEEGICHILVDGPEFKLLRRNRLGDSCHATPAIAGSTLVVRTGKALWRIGEKTH